MLEGFRFQSSRVFASDGWKTKLSHSFADHSSCCRVGTWPVMCHLVWFSAAVRSTLSVESSIRPHRPTINMARLAAECRRRLAASQELELLSATQTHSVSARFPSETCSWTNRQMCTWNLGRSRADWRKRSQKPSHRTVFILRESPWRRTEELITAISCHGREHGGSDVSPQTVPQRTV